MSARIFRPSRGATSSGTARTKTWVLEFEPVAGREAEPLMGWTSSSDMNSQVKLSFATKDEAIAYCERRGLAYSVEEPKLQVRKVLSYADNFKTSRLDQWTH